MDEFSLKEELKIDYKNLDSLSKACSSQAAKYQYYLEQTVLITKKFEDLDNFINYQEELFKSLKGKKLIEVKVDKITDKLAESYVLNDEEVLKQSKNLYSLRLKLNEVRKDLGVLKSFIKGYEQKKDMLVTIGHNLRTEYFSDTEIKKEETNKKIRRSYK